MRTKHRILWVFLAGLIVTQASPAQEPAHVWTVAELFTRNIGTTQQALSFRFIKSSVTSITSEQSRCRLFWS